MVAAEREHVGAGLSLVFGLGIGLFVLHVAHLLGEGESFRTILYGVLLPMAFTVGLLAGGVWLWRSGELRAYAFRIGIWTLVGAIVLALGAGLTILHEAAEGVAMREGAFVVATQASIGAVIGFVVGVYDARQLAAKADSERVNDRLTVLNRVLRHDIRNGADAIMGWAELLADGDDPASGSRRIERQAANLAELGDHARTIERLVTGETPRERVDLVGVIEDHLARLRREHPTLAVTTSLPSAQSVRAHPLISSAIGNVLENAVEHNDAETPELIVECAPGAGPDGDRVDVRVADNGPGMPETEVATLERGYETALEHTSGLGLWLVNWIVTESAGEVSFESRSPRGSIVTIRLETG